MGDHASRQHSVLSPSGAHRWLKCTASAALEATLPDNTSVVAAEGTLAHEICELKLQHYFFTADMTKRKFTLRYNKLKADPLYQQEMDGYTDSYVDIIKAQALKFESAPVVKIEEEFDLREYIRTDEAHGSADCVLISSTELHVYDFKYGKGVPVSATENPQMMLYALGAYNKYSLIYPIQTVHMHIIQPRLDNNSDYTVTVDKLLEFGEMVAQTTQQIAEGETEFVPGEAQCRFCRARAICRARADYNVQLAFATDKKPDTLSNTEIGGYLQKGEDIAKWVKDLEEYALSQCLAGKEIPGYKAVNGRSTRKWTDQDKAFTALKEHGIDEAVLYERKPVTLAQAEKIIGKQEFNEIVGCYIDSPPGKPTLVKYADKRPAITNVTKAKDAF